jgi:hypothetical protein
MQLNYLSFTLITSEKSEAMLPPILSSHAPKTTTSRKTTKPSITKNPHMSQATKLLNHLPSHAIQNKLILKPLRKL